MATKTVKDATQAFENMAADTQTAAKEQFEKLGKGVEQAVARNLSKTLLQLRKT